VFRNMTVRRQRFVMHIPVTTGTHSGVPVPGIYRG